MSSEVQTAHRGPVTPLMSEADAKYERRMMNRCAILFAMSLFGYPIAGAVISLLQVDSRALSVPFRIAVALLSIWVILSARRLKLDLMRQLMLLVWFLYVIRLLHDWLGPDLQGADFALQFFIISSVFPAFALMKARVYSLHRFAMYSFIVASTGALLGLFGGIFGSADVQEEGSVGGRLGLAALNPVTLGNEATSAVLCGLVLWRDARMRWRFILVCVFGLLVLCLVLTGSKGPLLQLVVCAALWGLRRGYFWRLAIFAFPALAWFVLASGNPLADRLATTGDDSSTVDRVVMITDSLKQIQDSPWLGSAFIELNSGFYPHNVLVEAGLALGVPVGLVLIALIFTGTFRAWKTLKTDYDLLGVLYFQGLLDSVFAGSLYGMTQLWVLMAMIPVAGLLARRRTVKLPALDLSQSSAA